MADANFRRYGARSGEIGTRITGELSKQCKVRLVGAARTGEIGYLRLREQIRRQHCTSVKLFSATFYCTLKGPTEQREDKEIMEIASRDYTRPGHN